jgi:hemerythrin
MALIAWRKEFETGIAGVDHEHRELVELINDLHKELNKGATQQDVTAFLGEVFARIAAHFALEESVMRKHRYDEYAAHKAEHEHLLDEIRDIMERSEEGFFDQASEALATTVRDWFVNHFKTKDARLHGKLGV